MEPHVKVRRRPGNVTAYDDKQRYATTVVDDGGKVYVGGANWEKLKSFDLPVGHKVNVDYHVGSEPRTVFDISPIYEGKPDEVKNLPGMKAKGPFYIEDKLTVEARLEEGSVRREERLQ